MNTPKNRPFLPMTRKADKANKALPTREQSVAEITEEDLEFVVGGSKSHHMDYRDWSKWQ